MVTIEQKLLLFSKLLNQAMDKKFEEEFENIEQHYMANLQKSKDEVDKEAKNIIDNARKKVEAGKIEILSKTKISIKKEKMAVKEKHFNILMEHIKQYLIEFIVSEKYGNYLTKIIEKLNNEITAIHGEEIVLYLTNRDNEKFSSLIKRELELKNSFKKIDFKVIDDSIIGGITIIFPNINLKFDMTIKSILEENEAYIMQTLFEALEAGEHIGI